ncbi:MAG TPA: VanW family protein [Candidatus Cryosericum sp.]|nr:VanW family protein [Candidatus Cryosericum sp.]
MYEKYSGLPDTTKSASQSNGRGTGRPAARNASSEGNHGGMDAYYAPNRGGSSASGKRKNSKRAKIRKRRFVLTLMTILFLALIIVAVVVLARSCGDGGTVDLATGKFRSEVYINGMNLSGKTVDEVRPQLESNETYALNNISIALSSDAVNATITGADMKASSNLNEIIQNALDGGANQVYYTTISIDDAALTQRLEDINASLNSAPTEPSFTIDVPESGKPTFNYVDGMPGYGLDVASTVQLVKDAVTAGQLQTTIQPVVSAVQPTQTIDDLKAHTALIGDSSTTYDFKGTAEDTEEQRAIIPNRAFNVEKAASLINNNVVKPGETWSFNEVVGDRTEENGWLEANGIFGGDTYDLQFGGGVCQVSTTLYNSLLEAYPYFAGTFDRKKHTIPSTYVEKGLDATVDTDRIDFGFTNNSDYPIYIFAYVSKNKMATTRKRDLHVLIYGEALPEGTKYKARSVIVETIPVGEDIIVNSSSMYVTDEPITLADRRDGYVVDVYIDRYLNDQLQESIFLYTDRYPGNPAKIKVGTKATPEPTVTPEPAP